MQAIGRFNRHRMSRSGHQSGGLLPPLGREMNHVSLARTASDDVSGSSLNEPFILQRLERFMQRTADQTKRF